MGNSNLEYVGEITFEAIVEKYEDEVFRLALVLSSSVELAEAILCEVFCAAYEEMPEDADIRTWLYEKTVSVWFSMRAEEQSTEVIELEDNLPEEISTAFSKKLDNAISELPDDLRVVLVLSDVDGFTRDEIAELLNESKAYVSDTLAEARSIITKKLGDFVSAQEIGQELVASKSTLH